MNHYNIFIISFKKYNSDLEFIELKNNFLDKIRDISILFIPDEYMPKRNMTTTSYLTHKILKSFNNVFDIGHITDFNKLELAEQVSIIKEILNLVLQDVKEDKKIPNYNPKNSPIKNRVLTTVVFNKKTNSPYYLICVKNTKSEQVDKTGLNPILYDLKNNLLITDKSMTEIYNDNYIIKDADMKFMIEEMDDSEKVI